jgi:hypothetical protein
MPYISRLKQLLYNWNSSCETTKLCGFLPCCVCNVGYQASWWLFSIRYVEQICGVNLSQVFPLMSERAKFVDEPCILRWAYELHRLIRSDIFPVFKWRYRIFLSLNDIKFLVWFSQPAAFSSKVLAEEAGTLVQQERPGFPDRARWCCNSSPKTWVQWVQESSHVTLFQGIPRVATPANNIPTICIGIV